MLKKIHAKTTIIVEENKEPYYFITICKRPNFLSDVGFNPDYGWMVWLL